MLRTIAGAENVFLWARTGTRTQHDECRPACCRCSLGRCPRPVCHWITDGYGLGMTGAVVRVLAFVAAVELLTGCVVAAGSGGDGSSVSVLFLLVPFALVLVMAGLAGRRPRGRRRSSPSQSVGDDDDTANAQVLRAELSVLADDVIRLEPRVALKEEARSDYEAATHRYRVAQAALDYAKEPVDLVRVQRVVDEATWSMSRARAILEGRPLPEPPPALRRPGLHGEPAVGVDEGQHPIYVDSPAAFRSGWFSAGGGLFGGLLLGSMLGGFGGGWIVHERGDDVDGDNSHFGDW